MGHPLLQAISPSNYLLDEESSQSQHHQKLLLACFILGGLTILVVLFLIIFMFRNFVRQKLKASREGARGSPDVFSQNLQMISYFDYNSLKKATKNFHPSNLLGKGGFGPVYRGRLQDGRLVAVKRLSLEKSQQGELEFLAEVRMITSIQHKNLVRLLGCCSDGPQRLLVYDYMKNGSLDRIIYAQNGLSMSWRARFQIIVGVGRGLQYLHEDSHLRIIHRDIKASNILLDEKFHPKIGDFGLARFFPEDQAYLSTNFAGTLGYTAPEYAIRGELSEKADIYSFGVLMLEIISCRKNTDLSLPSEMQYLPEYAWKLYESSRVVELVDPLLRVEGFVEKDAVRMIQVAFLCLQPHPKLRPPMSEVVTMLTCKAEITRTPISRLQFLEACQRKNYQNLSWDSISDPYPSMLQIQSESSTFACSYHSPS